MSDIPTDELHATHFGWQNGDIEKGEDHLMIVPSFEQLQATDNSAVISFENPNEKIEQPPDTSNQPSSINVDSEGWESPLNLLGSQEPLDDQAVPPLVWFGDELDLDTSLDSTDQQVFS